jgi:hypothetical protein
MLTAQLVSIVRRLTPNAQKKRVTREEREFAEEATATIRKVVGNKAFLDTVRRSNFSWAFWLAPDNTMREQEPEQVAAIISAGVEGGVGPPDGSVDLAIVLADLSEKALARTLPRESETQTDTDFFERCLKASDPGELAAVWMHEWMHALGFVHRTDVGDQDDVPYTIERIVRNLAARRTRAKARRRRHARRSARYRR